MMGVVGPSDPPPPPHAAAITSASMRRERIFYSWRGFFRRFRMPDASARSATPPVLTPSRCRPHSYRQGSATVGPVRVTGRVDGVSDRSSGTWDVGRGTWDVGRG